MIFLKKFFKYIYYLATILIILLAILFVGSIIPLPNNYQIMSVLSGSMEPSIKVGSIVFTKLAADYEIGDVITFKSAMEINTPITHRIINQEVIVGKTYYITKGDANDDPDSEKVEENKIIGKVFLTIPFLGYGIDFVRKPIGFLLIIIIPASIIILDEIRKIIREIKKKKADKNLIKADKNEKK